MLDHHVPLLVELAEVLVSTFQIGGKVFLFGNGGSAADAQHVAAELVNRFLLDRGPLPALALTTDTSTLTAIANDIGFDQVFARQVRALVRAGDVAVGISTSGNSPNVLNGVVAAREQGAVTVGFAGRDGGRLKELVDICFCAPSTHTPRIQEAHLLAWHAICEVVEQELSGT
ncbi:MAG: D-sedoheptulose 7-phosphate isomerase [Anaerolineae bacterium]|nr:D-sedoheptulose 7-phosphate isomerase [Anaerolineae bacterium]